VLLWKIVVALVNWIQNLEQGEGLKCKIGWVRAFMELEF
jgi:hypothetical protein